MAVGSGELGTLKPVAGIRLGVTSAGIKTPGRKDLVLIEAAPGGNTAAVFTQNAFCAAPVTVAREHLAGSSGQPRFDQSAEAAASRPSDVSSCDGLAALAGSVVIPRDQRQRHRAHTSRPPFLSPERERDTSRSRGWRGGGGGGWPGG